MYSNYDGALVVDNFHRAVKSKAKKLKIILMPPTIIVALFLLFILSQASFVDGIDPGGFLVLFFSFLILLVLVLLLAFSNHIYSNSLSFNYLYKDIYSRINSDLNLNLVYQTKDKVDNKFVEAGGLFTKQARVHSFRHVIGKTENDNQFQLFDLMLITGGGQYQQTHLNGFYLYTKVKSDQVIQIRSSGKPQTKRHQYSLIEGETGLSVYIKSGESLDSLEKMLIQKVKELKERLSAKHIYLSINEGVLHFAFMSKKKQRNQTRLDIEKLNEIYQTFLSEINLVDEFVNIFDF